MKKAHFLFALAFVFFFTSCHIEKRIYRPGHYISTKQHHKAESSGKTAKTETKPSGDVATPSLRSNAQPRILSHSPSISFPHAQTQTHSRTQTSSDSVTVESPADLSTASAPVVKETVQPQKIGEKEGAGDQGSKKGLWMIIIGLLLLGIGYLVSFLGVLGLIFFVVFAIAAAVYIVVGIFVLLFS